MEYVLLFLSVLKKDLENEMKKEMDKQFANIKSETLMF